MEAALPGDLNGMKILTEPRPLMGRKSYRNSDCISDCIRGYVRVPITLSAEAVGRVSPRIG
eukprot:2566815-Heterocapsa_arctica.AAC.1